MTNNNKPETLLPCPFCGNQPKQAISSTGAVGCKNPECPIRGQAITRQDWNNRPAQQQSAGTWQDVKGILDIYGKVDISNLEKQIKQCPDHEYSWLDSDVYKACLVYLYLHKNTPTPPSKDE